MSYTPFNAPVLAGLLGDLEIAKEFSIQADLNAMIRFETELAFVQEKFGLIPSGSAENIKSACDSLEVDIKELQAGTIRDGMAVPTLVKQLRMACGEHGKHLHFGTTSQDVIDTSLALRLLNVNAVLRDRLVQVIAGLSSLIEKYGNRSLMLKTRMQSALSGTVSNRVDAWVAPLTKQLECFDACSTAATALQLGGPVGDLRDMEKHGEKIRTELAANLGLSDPGACWHTDRRALVEYCGWLAQTSVSLGKLGQDFILMSQDERNEISFSGAGGSSAMAHKQNPVLGETLLAQAKFIAMLHSGMMSSAIHEQERSGSYWTLEWMIIPQICVATGSALSNAIRLISSIENMGHK